MAIKGKMGWYEALRNLENRSIQEFNGEQVEVVLIEDRCVVSGTFICQTNIDPHVITYGGNIVEVNPNDRIRCLNE